MSFEEGWGCPGKAEGVLFLPSKGVHLGLGVRLAMRGYLGGDKGVGLPEEAGRDRVLGQWEGEVGLHQGMDKEAWDHFEDGEGDCWLGRKKVVGSMVGKDFQSFWPLLSLWPHLQLLQDL